MLKNEPSMPNILNTKSRFVGIGHRKFSWMTPKKANVSKPKTFHLQRAMNHYSLKTSIQKNSPCFLFNPSCDDIIIRKGINRIETLCKHINH
jgi:hypothetical protein